MHNQYFAIATAIRIFEGSSVFLLTTPEATQEAAATV
jgi:hypothetical protein